MTKDIHNLKIGVLGGGQLGRMMALDAARLDIRLHFLDKDPSYPAGLVTAHEYFTVGDYNNYDDVLAFGKDKDVVSIEIEHVNVSALRQLEQEGKRVYPQPDVIALIQDKGQQKQFYTEHDIATSDYFLTENAEETKQKITAAGLSYPLVQKMRTGGYDGKGVQIVKSADELWDTSSVIESLVDIDKELAVLVCRDQAQNTVCYDTVEMIFDPKSNLLDFQLAPANVSKVIDTKCQVLAMQIADQLGIVGLLAVELFLTKGGDVLVNEVAPRTHNSGHHTIDACRTSQFEQLVRILGGLPMGSTEITATSYMINLVGDDDTLVGSPTYNGLSDLLKRPDTKVHIYGKDTVKPNRKMGHLNVLTDDLTVAKTIKNTINVRHND